MYRPPHWQEFLAQIDNLTQENGRPASQAGPTAYDAAFGFHRIVVAVDGTPGSRIGVQWARELAKAFHSKVWVASVSLPIVVFGGGVPAAIPLEMAEDRARRALDEARRTLTRGGIDAVPVLMQGTPIGRLVDLCRQVGADLVIAGSPHRTALGRTFHQSVGQALKNHADTNVLLARRPPPATRILSAVDGSLLSREAALYGLRLRELWDGELDVVHSFFPKSIPRAQDYRATRPIGVHAYGRLGPRIAFERKFGPASEGVLEAAKDHASDLIVMGCRGLGALDRLFLGSTSSHVSTRADASVLIVRTPTTSEAEGSVHPAGSAFPTRLDVSTEGQSRSLAATDR